MNHALIRTIPLFAGVKRRRRQELAALMDEITVPAGTTLTREGAHADEFFVVVDGEADVVRLSPLQTSDAPTRLGTLGPGDFFGEIGLLEGPKRSATVIAITPMRLLVAHSRDFRTLMHSFPGIAKRVRVAFAARTGRGRERKKTGQLPEGKSSHMEDTIKHEEQNNSRRWKALAVLCTAFFMVILDVAVVNVALPPIQDDLGFSPANLQWVVSAYALTFGGLLLLGGRAADLLGRRRMLVIGLLLFAGASLLAGIAWSEASMIAARAIQGVGAAVMVPAALSIIMTTFHEGTERNKALGVWGAVGASGATFGLIVGGVIADTIGWEWIFLLNVPIALVTMALAFVFVDESRVPTRARRFDVAGAVSVTAGLALLVYAIVNANGAGWGSAETVGLLAVSGVLLGSFALIELRSSSPLVPFRIFRLGALAGSDAAGLMLGAAMFGSFFIITLFLQQVLGFSPLEAGFAWLATSLTALVSAMGSQALVTRVGTKRPLAIGLVIAAVGLYLLSRISAEGSYFPDLALPMIVFGLGMGAAFVSISIGALEGVEERDAGLASGLVNTAQQIGGALGVAVLSSVALSRTGDLLASAPGTPQAVAITEGFRSALVFASGLALMGALLALVLIRSGGVSEEPVEAHALEPALEPALEEGGA